MALTIEMPPEAEARLREKAHRRGQAAEDYVRDLVERDLSAAPAKPSPAKPSRDEIAARLQAWREFAQDVPDYRAQAGLPPLSDEDISRETIYAERGLVDGEL